MTKIWILQIQNRTPSIVLIIFKYIFYDKISRKHISEIRYNQWFILINSSQKRIGVKFLSPSRRWLFRSRPSTVTRREKWRRDPLKRWRFRVGAETVKRQWLKQISSTWKISTNVTEKIPEQNAGVYERKPKKRRYV